MLKVDGSKIQNNSRNIASNIQPKNRNVSRQLPDSAHTNVSFQGRTNEFTKHGWYALRSISDKMQNASEITNALIQAIGTGIIAPLIILVSPGKGDKEDNDKKFFQAIRQPLSAGLALAFQLPATMAVNRFINNLAYEKRIKLFKDDKLGNLIHDKKYLKKRVTAEEINEFASKFEEIVNGKSLRQELEDKIRNAHEEVGLKISDEKLAKLVEKEKHNFLKDKVVEKKHERLLAEKMVELKENNFDVKTIKETELVTDKYKDIAILRNERAYAELEKKANLSFFDKLARLLGLSTSNVKKLEDAQKKFATETGLQILKEEEFKKPDSDNLFRNAEAKLKRFIENQDAKSQKFFGNKKFWLSLFVNLFMVTASCYALNWAHPRFKELIDKHKANNNEQPQPVENKKVEVEA